MQIKYIKVNEWPPLAWLAHCLENNETITLYHGENIEVNDHWYCEAVWDGSFQDGAFDQTDIIAGSGGRLRDNKMTFVSSGTTVDRIQMLSTETGYWVSNSLACLLANTNSSVANGYPNYWEDFGTIINGLDVYKKNISSSAGEIQLIYFQNLSWDGKNLSFIDKPETVTGFKTFSDYYGFLTTAFSAIADNMSDSARHINYDFLGTLSSGYDSTTVTTLAAQAGCTEALSFANAQDGEPDNGIEAAKALGIKLHMVERENWKNIKLPEIPFIAADAKGEDRYFSAAESLLHKKVLITGFHGDKIWDKHTKNLTDQIVRGDRSGLSLTEYRLRAGFIHCPITFWGVRRSADIAKISNLDEMSAWNVDNDYNRPICRRIAEQSGIPREAFGMKKKAASEQPFASQDFLTPTSMEDYIAWLKKHRWELVREGRFPIIISLSIDKVFFIALQVTESLAHHFSVAISKTPILWRLTTIPYLSKKIWRIRTIKVSAKPIYLRKYLFSWALENAQKSYSIPDDQN